MIKKKLFFGWYVVASCFVISVLGIGARYIFGVFLKPLELEFGMSRSAVSSLFSIYMLLCCLITPFGGWALDRFGPKLLGLVTAALIGIGFFSTSQITSAWQLLLTYSLLLSLGTASLYTVANSTSSRWFKQQRGLVVGITSSGGGMGVVILAPLAAFLIAQFDWRIAFLITGIIIWVGMTVASMWLVKDPADLGLFPDGERNQSTDETSKAPKSSAGQYNSHYTLQEAVRMKAFWLLLMTWLTISLTLHMVFVHVVPYAQQQGIDPLDAAFIISLIGFGNIVGRLVVGRISDRFGRNTLGSVCLFCMFSAQMWLIMAHELWELYGFALLFGFFWGGGGAMTTVLIGDIFGTRYLGSIMGIIATAWSVGAALGPGIAGIIFDMTDRYFVAFSVGAASLFVAIFMVWFARIPSEKK
jgi:MFS family permease